MSPTATTSAAGVRHLTVVYDDTCPFCCWCRDWIVDQHLLVPVTLRPSSDPWARRQWGHVPGYGQEVFVADQDGNCWVGPPAFVMALWATRAWRHRAHELTGPAARHLLGWLSDQRRTLSTVLRAPALVEDAAPCHDDACHPEVAWTPPTDPSTQPGPRPPTG